MKKHIILTILSVAAIFASCNNGFEPKPVLPEGNGLILSLDSRPMVTKADDAPVLPAYETAIDHFDFFFFDDEEGATPTTGMHARVSGASTQLATGTGEAYAALRDGTHYVYILANYPDEIDHTSDWKLADILALEFESKIVKEKKTEVNPVTGKVEETGEVVSGPDIVSRGFVYVRESEELMDEARTRVEQALDRCQDEGVIEWGAIKSNIRDALGRYLFDKTRRRPMILPSRMQS